MTERRGLILVVDDNDSARYLKVRLLRREGWRVEEAETGERALEMLDRLPIDLVVLDIQLPGISGLDVCRRIKAQHSGVLVLHASATFVGTRDRIVGLEGGADAYLAEPIEDAELTATVHALMRLRRSEMELRARERELTDFVENAAMALQWVAPNGTILWANRAQLEMLGYAAGEFVGRPVTDFCVDREAAEKLLGRFERGDSFSDFSVELRHHDGSVRDILISANPYRRDGALIHNRCFARDMTERNRARLATVQLAAIVSSSGDAILSISPDGTVRTWNRAATQMFGYTADEIIGRSIEVLLPDDRKHEIGLVTARVASEGLAFLETQHCHKDGHPVEVAVTVSPLRSAAGVLVGYAATVRDITNRKRAEQQRDLMLRELDHRISNLFSVVSAMIGLSAQFAQSPKQLAESLRARIDALARSHQLIRGTALDSAVTVRQVVDIGLSPYGGVAKGRIAIEGPDLAIGPSAVISLNLIVHELLTNAVKYGALSTSDGRLSITWSVMEHRQGEFQLTWRESGLSTPPVEGRAGFGSILLKQSARGMGGEFTVEFGKDGLVAKLKAPVARISAEQGNAGAEL